MCALVSGEESSITSESDTHILGTDGNSWLHVRLIQSLMLGLVQLSAVHPVAHSPQIAFRVVRRVTVEGHIVIHAQEVGGAHHVSEVLETGFQRLLVLPRGFSHVHECVIVVPPDRPVKVVRMFDEARPLRLHDKGRVRSHQHGHGGRTNL